MAEVKKKPPPREYCISRVQKIIKAEYSKEAVQKYLPRIKGVLDGVSQGEAIFAQVEKLILAENGDRAIKLLEVAPFRSAKLPLLLAMIGIFVAGLVAALVFALGKS